jgi:hypothetical protein
LENTAHQVFVEQPALMPVQVQPMLVQHMPVWLEQVQGETGVLHSVGPIQWEPFQHEQPAAPRTPRQSFVEVPVEVPVEVKKVLICVGAHTRPFQLEAFINDRVACTCA